MRIRTVALSAVVLHGVLILDARDAWSQQLTPVKLVIMQNGKEAGREQFTFREGRARGLAGSTLTSAARFPAAAPTLQLGATLERAGDGSLAKFQLDVESPSGTTVILAAGTGARLIVRTVAKSSEAGRELPGGPDVVLLDENIYALYAQVARLATPEGKRLTGIFARSGKRSALTATRQDDADGDRIHVALNGDVAGSLVCDADGRLVRLELPASGIVVTRQEE